MNNIKRVKVGMASCGLAAGAQVVFDHLKEELTPKNILVERTGCIGMCFREPLVEVEYDDGSSII